MPQYDMMIFGYCSWAWVLKCESEEAIALWIETAKEFGDPIKEPKGRRLIFA